MSDFITKPCQHCPFRVDVTPFLRPARAEELAFSAQNPWASFPCHKTTNHEDEDEYGEPIYTDQHKEKQCAGFLTLRFNELGESGYEDEGFIPATNVYSEAWDMIAAYEEEYSK